MPEPESHLLQEQQAIVQPEYYDILLWVWP